MVIVPRYPCLPNNKKQQSKTYATKTKVGVGSKSQRHMWNVLKFRLEIECL